MGSGEGVERFSLGAGIYGLVGLPTKLDGTVVAMQDAATANIERDSSSII